MEIVGGFLFILVLVALSLIWIWALIDAVRVPDGAFRRWSKLTWVLLIALFHLVGTVLYLTMGRPRRDNAIA